MHLTKFGCKMAAKVKVNYGGQFLDKQFNHTN